MNFTIGCSHTWSSAFQSLHEQLVAHLSIAWPACTSHFSGKYIDEQDVTDKLVIELRKAGRKTKPIAARIESEYKLLKEEAASGTVETKGFIDMALLVGDDEDIYVAYECKWLNVPTTTGTRVSQVGKYLATGLKRYISEQYAMALPRGYMMGYVHDNELAAVSGKIRARISKCAADLKCTTNEQWSPVGANCQWLERRQSEHDRGANLIVVEHLLLQYQPTLAK